MQHVMHPLDRMKVKKVHPDKQYYAANPVDLKGVQKGKTASVPIRHTTSVHRR